MRTTPRGTVERTPSTVEQRTTSERVAVAAQTGAREADDRVAGSYFGGKDLAALDDADRETHEIELTGIENARVLRHLAADERTPRVAATAHRDTRHDLVGLLGYELAHRDVVEEEQWLGASAAMSSTDITTQSMPIVS